MPCIPAVGWHHDKDMPQRVILAMAGLRRYRVEDVVVEVQEIDALLIMVAGTALRRGETQRLPADGIDDLVEVGLRLLRRVLWHHNRIDDHGGAVKVGRLVAGWAACHRRAGQSTER